MGRGDGGWGRGCVGWGVTAVSRVPEALGVASAVRVDVGGVAGIVATVLGSMVGARARKVTDLMQQAAPMPDGPEKGALLGQAAVPHGRHLHLVVAAGQFLTQHLGLPLGATDERVEEIGREENAHGAPAKDGAG